MKIKKTLIVVTVLCTVLTGCNNKSIEEDPIADKATQQRTMTKVQNDVNEIIGKDYEYVLKNMGIPYCITYYIGIDNVEVSGVTKASDLEKLTNHIRLVYPKYEANDELGKSALYVELIDNKVSEVQTNEFTEYDINKEEVNSETDIILDTYDPTPTRSLEEFKDVSFEEYVGKSLDELNDIININKANFEVYDNNRENLIMGYFLSDKGQNSSNILSVVEYEGKIREINILEASKILELLEKYLIKH